ncbi:MAG: hypothetical protein ACYDDI_09865 [Candidatus Acidiferrales bacterium]
MSFVHLLVDTPVLAFLLLLGLLVTVVPLALVWLSHRKKSKHPDEVHVPVKEIPTTRFLGTQLDLAILFCGFLLLLGLLGWAYKLFVG